MREIECDYEITIISGKKKKKKTGRSQFMSNLTSQFRHQGIYCYNSLKLGYSIKQIDSLGDYQLDEVLI